MFHDGRHIPPSGARRAAAAKQGLFVQPTMLSAGAVLLSLAAAFHLFGSGLAHSLSDLTQMGLRSAFEMRPLNPGALTDQMVSVAKPLLFMLLIPLAVALAVTSAPSIIAKKGQSSTPASPLPERLTNPMGSIVLKVFAVLFFLFSSGALIMDRLIGYSPTSPDPSAMILHLGGSLTEVTAIAGVVAFILGLADAGFRRSSLLQDLSLTTGEARREARAAGADPRMRTALRRSARERQTP